MTYKAFDEELEYDYDYDDSDSGDFQDYDEETLFDELY